jgi:hypothetical protein
MYLGRGYSGGYEHLTSLVFLKKEGIVDVNGKIDDETKSLIRRTMYVSPSRIFQSLNKAA